MTVGNGYQSMFRLKAKEKVLVQLCLHRCEPDEGTFPFEVTQKGLSDHLGLRRSHVAVALQDLVKDGLVEAVKGHVDGEDRRQNAYCITPKGVQEATSVSERLLEVEVTFEDSSGTRTVKISEIVTSRKASLASVISQMDRGGPVRDEIAVVTKPEKKQISVFCPTCKKQIEVDNIFVNEEVGFDCPGCGRPYRIVPARSDQVPVGPEAPAPRRRPAGTIFAILVIVAIAWLGLFVFPSCLSVVLLAAAAIGSVVWILIRAKKTVAVRPRTRVGAVTYTVALSPVVLFAWHMWVASIHPWDTAEVVVPIVVFLSLAYVAVYRILPEFKGDYLLSSGLGLVFVAASTMILEDFGKIDVGMAPTVGICGAVFVVLSTFHPTDRDALILDGAMAFGAFLLLLVGVVLVWQSSEAIDYIALEALVFLGTILIALRVARELLGSKNLSSHLVAAMPLTLALGLGIIGVFLVKGDAVIEGCAELVIAVAVAYFGSQQVFNEHWPYRVPIVVLFAAVLILTVTAGLVT